LTYLESPATGIAVYRLHPGIWQQMVGSSLAWTAWDPMALRLCDDALALYLHARRQHHREVARQGNVPRRFNLARIATHAGVWNSERYAKDRGRYLAGWNRKLGAAGDLGLSLELAGSGAVLVVSPLSQGSLKFQREALPEGVLPPSPYDLPAGGAKSAVITINCKDDFRAERTNFRVQRTRAKASSVGEHTTGVTHEG
jgi:hypothetical protein